jgi:hypothetical protein
MHNRLIGGHKQELQKIGTQCVSLLVLYRLELGAVYEAKDLPYSSGQLGPEMQRFRSELQRFSDTRVSLGHR